MDMFRAGWVRMVSLKWGGWGESGAGSQSVLCGVREEKGGLSSRTLSCAEKGHVHRLGGRCSALLACRGATVMLKGEQGGIGLKL